jgi:hypothetical protein
MSFHIALSILIGAVYLLAGLTAAAPRTNFDVSTELHISDAASAERVRAQLVAYVWKAQEQPHALLMTIGRPGSPGGLQCHPQ